MYQYYICTNTLHRHLECMFDLEPSALLHCFWEKAGKTKSKHKGANGLMDRKDLPVDNNFFSSSSSLAKRDMIWHEESHIWVLLAKRTGQISNPSRCSFIDFVFLSAWEWIWIRPEYKPYAWKENLWVPALYMHWACTGWLLWPPWSWNWQFKLLR